jgi:uncharacterized RDD family membrane protein YckC
MNENFWKWYGQWLLKVFSFKWIGKIFAKDSIIIIEFICSILLFLFSLVIIFGEPYINISHWWLLFTLSVLFFYAGYLVYEIEKTEAKKIVKIKICR